VYSCSLAATACLRASGQFRAQQESAHVFAQRIGLDVREKRFERGRLRGQFVVVPGRGRVRGQRQRIGLIDAGIQFGLVHAVVEAQDRREQDDPVQVDTLEIRAQHGAAWVP